MKSPAKMKEIQQKLLSSSFNVILGTETSWDESVRSEEIFGNNFNVFRHDRNLLLTQKKSGGGVLIAINADFTSEEIKTNKHKEFEHVWAKALIAGETHIFSSVYFPPEHAQKQSFELFFQIVENIMSNMEPEVKLHIYGDFNQRNADFIPDIENESFLLPVVGEDETLQFISDKISFFGLHQINHVRNQQNTYLDLLFTNCTEDFCVYASLSPLWKNEVFHTAIEYSIFIHNTSSPSDLEYEEVPEYHKTNFELAKRRLSTINWQTIISIEGNVDSEADKFHSIIQDLISESVPMKRRRRTKNSKLPVWFTPQLKHLKNKKQKAHKLYKKENSNTNLQNYQAICNQLNTAITFAHEEYNRKVENEVKSCPKNFFNYVKTKLKSSNFPSRMHLDGIVGENSSEICKLFAIFFQEVYTTFSEEDRDRNFFSFIPETSNSISVNQLSYQEVFKALKNLDASKGPGPDGIAPVFLKNLSEELALPLERLFNMSLKNGKFPEIWKSSYLVPIFKSGTKSDIRNYRGIAIISCIPKLFESIVNDKIFRQVKNQITNKQHGFYKGRSTTTNLLEFVTFILNAMDNGKHVEALYTDFSKAFDRIDIPLLLFKLHKIGMEPTLLNWLQSYLTHRKQIVRFQNKLSQPILVTSGVPQGSHLGPLLFILYVNDISFILKKIKLLVYADDMKLFMEISNSSDAEEFQNEINLFYTWCSKSLLQLNVKKCNTIAFSRKIETPHIAISLGNQKVEKCKIVRDLGVILDSKLTFIEHYNTIISKANSMLGFIKRFSHNFQDPYTIKLLYITYVRPILEYCNLVWNPYIALHEERIESVQKQFLLYALRKLNWTSFPLPSYEARCMLINLQTLKERREFAMLFFINDIISNRTESAALLSELNFYTPSRHLRTRKLFSEKSFRTNYAKNCPINRMMRQY
ncbi:unnamed protein product, partial [Brugia timori]|uniref:Reverse transcriptase domain-containing protein n=1 Tax=Brugia timori TaxID=42155 RepID=A0A0R3Q7A0_9BILA